MLMSKHSNLEIVSASKIKSRKYGLPDAEKRVQACIVLYVHIKGIIPFQEEPFPQKLDGFPVDVREGKFVEYSNPNYHLNLKMGCQIASAYDKAGSLGGFVQLKTGNIGCLTCWHIFETESSKEDHKKEKLIHAHFNREVFQPDMSKDEHKFGYVIDGRMYPGDENTIGVDAALIEIDPKRYPLDGGFPDATSEIAGFSTEMPMVYNSGQVLTNFESVPKTCNVVKYGFKTGHTVGLLRLAGTAAKKQTYTYYLSEDRKEEYHLYQQFEVFQPEGQQFSNFGDSGSLVFLVSDLGNSSPGYDINALGLLVGGTTYNTTIVTPIWAVLQSFGLPLQLLSFGPRAQGNEGIYKRNVGSRLGNLECDLSAIKTNMNFLNDKVNHMGSSIETKINTMDNSIQAMGTNIVAMGTGMQEMGNNMLEMKTFLQSALQSGPTAFQNNTTGSNS